MKKIDRLIDSLCDYIEEGIEKEKEEDPFWMQNFDVYADVENERHELPPERVAGLVQALARLIEASEIARKSWRGPAGGCITVTDNGASEKESGRVWSRKKANV